MTEDAGRYYFLGPPRQAGTLSRGLAAILLVFSLLLIFPYRGALPTTVLGLLAAWGLFGLIRPVTLTLFVEVGEAHLTINLLTPIRIPYDDIVAVGFRRFAYASVPRAIFNFFNAVARVAGASYPTVGPKGEVDRNTVELDLKRRRWAFLPLPPFVIGRKTWRLMVEDADSLRAELARRLEQARLEKT